MGSSSRELKPVVTEGLSRRRKAGVKTGFSSLAREGSIWVRARDADS